MIREREIAILTKVGKAAMQGCEAIWATATKVWATREKNLGIARCPRQAMKSRRQIRRSVALAIQQEDEEAIRKTPLVRFNVERADRLAQQTRTETRGLKRRWSLKESEAQRWPTMGATARLRWLARVETKGKKRSQTKMNIRQKRKGAETPPRKRTRTTEERQGEGKGNRARWHNG